MSGNQDSSASGIWKRHLAEWSRALFEGIDDAVLVHDLRGKILDVNPAACRRLGYTREELLKLRVQDIDEPEFAADFEKRLEVQMTEGSLRCEGKHRTKDGRVVLVDINTSAIEFRNKPCVLAVMRDITERKKAEQILVKQKELLRSILENMGDGVLVVDAREQLLLSNPLAQRLFGLTPRGAGQRSLWPPQGLYQPDQVTPFPAASYPWKQALQGQNVTDVQIFVRAATEDRGHWVSITARPLREAPGGLRGGIVVCRDITEQKRTERRQAMQAAIARVITGPTETQNLGQMLMKSLCDGLGWDMAILWVLDAERQRLRCSEVWYRPELPLTALAQRLQQAALLRGAGLAGRVWANLTPIWIANVQEEAELQKSRVDLQRSGLNSAFAFPIWSSGQITGVVSALSRQRDRPDQEMLTLVGTLGSQMGQVLERQRVEQALRESQAFYYSLVESLPQNLFRKDLAGRVTFANQRYCHLLNKTLPELVGKTDFDLFPEPLARKYREDDQKVLASGQPLQLVEEHSLPDGSRIYVEVIKTPIHDAARRPIGLQVQFWDVTERIMADQARAASERRYRQLTEATLDAIIVANHEGDITLFNPAAERLFGYQADEILGQPVDLLMPAEYVEQHRAGMQRLLNTRQGRILGKPLELQGRHKSGTVFPIEIVLTVMESGGRGTAEPVQFLGAIRDLTERNRIRTALIQNEKLASIGLLSAGVAHEINNPLAFIGNNLAVLQRDLAGVMEVLALYESQQEPLSTVAPDTAERIRAVVEEIDLPYIRANLFRLVERTRDGVDRVARIVHSLRGLARTGKPERLLASLPDLVDTSLEIIRSRIKRLNIRLEFAYDPDPVVSCVPTQISQVFLNLFVNAIQAIEAAQRSDGCIRVTIRRLAQEMQIDVADNGCGIAGDNLQRIFDPFFTTKDVGEGTGLGLSISHNIITGHGGRIELESTPGAGTIFHLFLPLNPM